MPNQLSRYRKFPWNIKSSNSYTIKIFLVNREKEVIETSKLLFLSQPKTDYAVQGKEAVAETTG